MIYFDNNATTRPVPDVISAMLPYLGDNYGNPSSAHAAGTQPRNIVGQAKEAVAGLLGARSAEIAFTSGGTESDNWAILGALELFPDKNHIVTTRVEHEAVRKLCEKLERKNYRVTWLDVDEDGALDLEQLERSLTAETAVVSIMMANNETGILFPISEIADIVKRRSHALFHVDGVNAAGKTAVELSGSGVDLFSISAHKFHGPKGVGALYIREGIELPPMLIGGGQEKGRRSGTEAVHQLAGIAAAAEYVKDLSEMERVRELRDRLENEILYKIPNSRLNGTANPAKRLPNTSSISFENINGEMLLARLDGIGICVSTGSACNSVGHIASPVLQAMNIPYTYTMGSIRFSLGRLNTAEEVDVVLAELPGIVADLSRMAGQT